MFMINTQISQRTSYRLTVKTKNRGRKAKWTDKKKKFI